MIKTISEMLHAFMRAESKKLGEYELKHAPSIGVMYEGLSSNILNKAIPDGLDLRVVGGFVVDAQGKLSGQIDCMLVTGAGERIPYSSSYKWPVWDVLAVIEVKKNLYGAELKDSFLHLRQVAESFNAWLFADTDEKRTFSLGPSTRAFETISGYCAPGYAERKSLPDALQLIYHTLVAEQLAPVLIVFGYDGYKSEASLREGLLKFLDEQGVGPRNGVPSFPHQITCNGNSLVKLNGQPYMEPMNGDYWTFYASTQSNPLWVMIELIWTKISNRFGIQMPWGEDLDVEVFSRLMTAKAMVNGEVGGWIFNYTSKTPDDDKSARHAPWTPTIVSSTQFVIFQQLCSTNQVDITEPEFVRFVSKDGRGVDEFVTELRSTGLVALDGHLLRLTTAELATAIIPDDGYVVAENNTGRLTRYVQRKIAEKANPAQ
jgi:hypothetical protein